MERLEIWKRYEGYEGARLQIALKMNGRISLSTYQSWWRVGEMLGIEVLVVMLLLSSGSVEVYEWTFVEVTVIGMGCNKGVGKKNRCGMTSKRGAETVNF